MKTSFSKVCITMGLAVAAITSASASAYNYFDKEEKCLKISDIQDIDNHFQQFQKFTTSGNNEICRDKVGEKWFEVVRTTLAIQKLNLTDAVKRDVNDDMTRKPLPNQNWWAYFTQRADNFAIEPSHCSVNANIVAYVSPWYKGRVNLCPQFFKMDPANQISTLMHEVRHFDGYPHVTCTQGNEIGSRGACDDKISTGGAYAVGTQADVELSFVKQLSEANRIISESSAIYSVNNKFNLLPIVKNTNYIYASNKDGEVWRMAEGNLSKPELVTKLKDAAYIYGNGSQFTVYPVNNSVDAYRISKSYKQRAKSIGAYANMYNADNATDRKSYGAISYYGAGSIVKDNQLHTFCGTQATSLSAKSFDNGQIQALPVLKDAKDKDHMYILSNSGDMFDFTCNQKTGELSITSVASKLPADATTAFSFDTKTAFVVTTSGALKSYNMDTRSYGSDLSTDTNWLNATSLSLYKVFDNDNL